MAKIEDKLKILPAMPGCYLMKNKDGDIIYVGKAKKLKQRVRQYFVGAHDFKTTRLVSNIDDFEYIVRKRGAAAGNQSDQKAYTSIQHHVYG